jgi:hypothetical protein
VSNFHHLRPARRGLRAGTRVAVLGVTMRLVVTILLASLLSGGLARAATLDREEPVFTPAPPAPGEPEREWYGWQVLASDALVAASWIGAAKGGGAAVFLLGEVTYVLGAPILHVVNNHNSAVVPSLLARLAAPVGGAALLYYINTSVCDQPTDGGFIYTDCQKVGAFVGLLPMLVTTIVDAAYSWRPRPAAPPATAKENTTAFAWAPTVAPANAGAGATLGLVGRF